MTSKLQAEAARECGGCANGEHCGACQCCVPTIKLGGEKRVITICGKCRRAGQLVLGTRLCGDCYGALHRTDRLTETVETMIECAAKLPKVAKPKKESRAKRWARLTNEAAALVDELTQLQSEFEEWRDNLPENLASSPLGEKLALVCDLDLQGALETLQEAENTEAPLGFGRD